MQESAGLQEKAGFIWFGLNLDKLEVKFRQKFTPGRISKFTMVNESTQTENLFHEKNLYIYLHYAWGILTIESPTVRVRVGG